MTKNTRNKPKAIVDKGSDSSSTDSELSFDEDSDISDQELPCSLNGENPFDDPPKENEFPIPKVPKKTTMKRLSTMGPAKMQSRNSLALFDDFESPSKKIKIKPRKRRNVPVITTQKSVVLPSTSFLDGSPQSDESPPKPTPSRKRKRSPAVSHKSPSPKRRVIQSICSIDDLLNQAQ